MSSRIRKTLQPQREVGRQRVAELMEAAAAVIQERGFEAATMAEIAERADAKIGSLYRFFPNKDAVAEALMQHYGEFLEAEYDRISAQAKDAPPEVVADLLMDLLDREPFRHVLPSRSCTQNPENAFQASAIGCPGPAATVFATPRLGK